MQKAILSFIAGLVIGAVASYLIYAWFNHERLVRAHERFARAVKKAESVQLKYVRAEEVARKRVEEALKERDKCLKQIAKLKQELETRKVKK